MQFAISLPTNGGIPVYRQVSEALRQAIAAGRLRPGERLPSTRELAEHLSLSRLTVSRGYEELLAQGYIKTIVGSGAYVSETAPALLNTTAPVERIRALDFSPPKDLQLSRYGKALMDADAIETATAELKPELNYGAPPLEHLPLARWKELLNKSTRFADPQLLAYQSDSFGYMPLRQAIAAYLYRSRLIKCTAEQVVVFSNTDSGLDLLSRLLLDAGDAAAVENPGFHGARRAFISNRAQLVPVPVDQDGLIVEDLKSQERPVSLIYVTPSHHDPTGAVLSQSRRRELLAFAHEAGAMIIEDDYDSEYRWGDQSYQSLFGMDTQELVIFRYNFWRVLYPLVRIGFIVLPKRMVPVVQRAKALVDRDGPLLEQHALAEFIADGHLDRHIKRTRPLYVSRRVALIQALTRYLKKSITIANTRSGLHLLARFAPSLRPEDIERAAARHGLPLVSTESHYIGPAVPGEYLIGFAHLDESEIAPKIQRFAKDLLIWPAEPRALPGSHVVRDPHVIGESHVIGSSHVVRDEPDVIRNSDVLDSLVTH